MSRYTSVTEGPLLLLPGNCETTVKQILPRILKILKCLRDWNKVGEAVVVYPDERIKRNLLKMVKNFPRCMKHARLTRFDEHKIIETSGAVMSSGTASLMVGLEGIPGIIVYKATPMTYWIGRLSVANNLNKRYCKLCTVICPQKILKQRKNSQTRQTFTQHADENIYFIHYSTFYSQPLSLRSIPKNQSMGLISPKRNYNTLMD